MWRFDSVILLAVVILLLLLWLVGTYYKKESFVSGENVYMEPEYNYFFSKCLQSYPIAYRGPVNDGWYTCARKTDELLRGLGQPCEFCYNKC